MTRQTSPNRWRETKTMFAIISTPFVIIALVANVSAGLTAELTPDRTCS
ncbi:MAG: hypothetical protein V4595_02570 [Pseudomonadota bacterium]|jgi:hypothetical protein